MTFKLFEDLTQEQINHFRVSIFGSARIKEGDPVYKQTFELAKALAEREIDVITGGGPGLMRAGNEGHAAGDMEHKSKSIGITIELPFEQQGNEFIEVRQHFGRFSGRLDEFMRLSNAVVVMPGGIGTCLELFFTWQLIQVKHVERMPIIVIGEMWANIIKWVRENPLENGYMSESDLDYIHVVSTKEEAVAIIEAECKRCALK
jgi:uncharacterized protein (TIGR00730 family)